MAEIQRRSNEINVKVVEEQIDDLLLHSLGKPISFRCETYLNRAQEEMLYARFREAGWSVSFRNLHAQANGYALSEIDVRSTRF